MTEDEARDRTREIVGPAAMARLERLVELVLAENEKQNLIARSTIPAIWQRHVLDSAQLLTWSEPGRGLWLDIGTGGGFPGLVIAAATQAPTMLTEPRRLRARFLADAAAALDLVNCSVIASQVENVTAKAAFISARAVAPIEKLLQAAAHCVTAQTRWLLLRGRLAPAERQTLTGRTDIMFHVEHSITDPESLVVLLDCADKSR